MKKGICKLSVLARLCIFSALLVLAAGPFYSTADAQVVSANTSTTTTASLIVKLVNGLTVDQEAAVITRNGGVEKSSVPALRLHVVEFPAADLAAILAAYQADPQVERVEINQTRKVEGAASDPFYSSQWALPKIGWDMVFGTLTLPWQTVVAVLDTGVDASHPDLSGNIISGTSIKDGSNGMTDPNGHGTWMAGIIAAVPDNNIGIAGVGYARVSIMPVTVLGADGTGQDSDIIAGVMYAADHGADVILMSFSNPGFSQNLQDAIDYAWSKNIVIVAATGNDGVNTPTYPAGSKSVVGVSATDTADALVSFSNYGQDAFLGAPGLDILTTGPADFFITLSGTSASAAIVAGVSAVMRAADPTLTNGVIVGRLARTADPAGTQEQTGNGRVNMERALADISTDPIQPAGALGGGPFVGPYTIAARQWRLTFAGTGSGSVAIITTLGTVNAPTSCGGTGSNTTSQTVTSTCSPNISLSENSATGSLTASPGLTSYFAGWSAASNFAGCSGTTNSCSFNVTGNSPSLTATFTLKTPLTPSFSASNKIYDGTNAASVSFTGFTSSVGSDNVSVTYTSATFADKNVGNNKTVTISDLSLTGTDAYKYTLSSTTVTTTANITPKPASVTPDAKSKVYGSSDPALTGTLTGFMAADNVTAAYSRTSGDTVAGSPYTISATLSPAGVLGNYNITYNTASFTITPKAASVTPNAANKILGATDPTFTGTLTGFLSSDNITAIYSRNAGETVGIYTISATLSPAGVLGNYNIAYNTATFNINYLWPGFLQPINDTAHQVGTTQSSFKAGQTIPAKFVLTDAAGTVVLQTGNPTFTRSGNLGACGVNTAFETVEAIQADTTPVYTWDGSQYHYNWSTKGLSAGLYRIFANLADGTNQWVYICLTK